MNKSRKFLLLIGIFILTFTVTSFSQVRTRIVEDSKAFLEIVTHHNPDIPISEVFQSPNVEKQIKDDVNSGIGIFRYAISLETELSIEDGSFYVGKNFTSWKLEINANGGRSINVFFKDFYLPTDSKMYIYSLDNKMISGPISTNNIFKGRCNVSIR